MGAIVIGFRHEHFGRAAQVTVIRLGWIHKLLGGGDPMLVEHDNEHLGVHDGTGVEHLHNCPQSGGQGSSSLATAMEMTADEERSKSHEEEQQQPASDVLLGMLCE